MRKVLKSITAILLVLVMTIACMPLYNNSANAEPTLPQCKIYITPLVENTKIGDIKLYGGGFNASSDAYSFFREDISDIVWYKADDIINPLSDTDVIEKDKEYIVSMTWNKRLVPVYNNLSTIQLFNAANMDADKMTEATYSSDALTDAKNNKQSYYTDLSASDNVNKKVVFYLDGTNNKIIIPKENQYNLYLYASPAGTDPTVDNIVPIEWSDIFTDGFDLNRVLIGKDKTEAMDAYTRHRIHLNWMDTHDDDIIENDEYTAMYFQYVTSSGSTKRDVLDITVNGKRLIRNNNGLSNFADELLWCKVDCDDDWLTNDQKEATIALIMIDYIKPIDSVKVNEAYVGSSYINFEIDDDELGITKDTFNNYNYTIMLAEGAYTKEKIINDPVDYFNHIYNLTLPNYYDYYDDNGKIYFTTPLTLGSFEDKDYTVLLLIDERATNLRIRKPYIGTFRPTVKNDSFNISLRDMKKGTNITDWLIDNLADTQNGINRSIITNEHSVSAQMQCFDEMLDTEVLASNISDQTKLNVTLKMITDKEPTEVKLVKGNSDYKEVTLTRNEYFNLFDEEAFANVRSDNYQTVIDNHQGFENQYNYKQISYTTPLSQIVTMYEVIAKVTLDFGYVPSSSSAKKYKVTTTIVDEEENVLINNKDTNTNKDYIPKKEVIAGSGKKGSTRTITLIEGREVNSIIARDKNNNIIDLTKNNDGTYSFIQPASDVNIEIEYKDKEMIFNYNSYDALVYGKKVKLDAKPRLIDDSRTVLPARFIAENLECDVLWDEKEPNRVVINDKNNKIEITMGSNIVLVNGKEVLIDVNAFIEEDRTFLPARFIAEIFGCDVFWDENKPSEVRIVQSFKK